MLHTNDPLCHGDFEPSSLLTTVSINMNSVNFMFSRAVNHFYWPTNALNCIKLNRLKST